MVVGLGNPGKKYESTRHNVGFMAVDLLCEKHGVRPKSLKNRSVYAFLEIGGKSVLAIKPQTFMNLSGEAVRDMAASFKIPAQNIIVVFDDAALAAGRIRVRRAGSDGGHNGIKSIIYQLSSDAFPRIKVGVGSPNREEEGLADYVLSEADGETLSAVRRVPEIVESIIKTGVDSAMQQFN